MNISSILKVFNSPNSPKHLANSMFSINISSLYYFVLIQASNSKGEVVLLISN